MNPVDFYPWQEEQWQRLQTRIQQQQLPHALLLTGKEGIGKRDFSLALGHSLLCAEPAQDGRACGICKSCTLLAADTHPDLLLVEPEEPGKAIKVDQVRRVVEFMSMTSQYGRYKIVIISPAAQMNINASNSLLKTLEEPSASSLLILETAWPGMLPATVRSRCQRIQFHLPPAGMALEWLSTQAGIRSEAEKLLALAGGAPLLACQLAGTGLVEKRQQRLVQLRELLEKRQDAVAVAGEWQKDDVGQALAWLSGWVMDLIRLKSTKNQQLLQHPEEAQNLQILAERLDLPVLFQYYDEVARARQLARTQVNKQLLLEGLLIQWSAGQVLAGDRTI